MNFIKIGALIKPFGLKGEMKVYNMSDFPEKRFKAGNTVYLNINNEMIAFIIESFRMHQEFPLLSFKNYQDINLIEKYNKAEIYMKKDELHHLNKGEYYIFELRGLNVVDQDNQLIGIVKDVEITGAHSVLRIKTDGKDVLVPYVPNFILDVDLKEKRITIKVIEGLL